MRDKRRISLITEVIEEIWKEKPDLRFGQLIYNLYKQYFGDVDMFYVEDDDLIEALFNENGEI
jgi:hypothetical protein